MGGGHIRTRVCGCKPLRQPSQAPQRSTAEDAQTAQHHWHQEAAETRDNAVKGKGRGGGRGRAHRQFPVGSAPASLPLAQTRCRLACLRKQKGGRKGKKGKTQADMLDHTRFFFFFKKCGQEDNVLFFTSSDSYHKWEHNKGDVLRPTIRTAVGHKRCAVPR